jgi:peptidoglycan/xylan/chitin deacetylase (PgdA/CDA1 family)
MRLISIGAAFAASLMASSAVGEECLGNPDAIGTSRTIAVNPSDLPRVGTMSYPSALKLEPKEVVLTFDDGPMQPMSGKILEILRAECVKATYFLIGRNAQRFPELVREIAKDGHTIGTHSQNHPLNFNTISFDRGVREIEDGIFSVAQSLEPAGIKPLPWFRFPGFKNTAALDNYLKSRHIVAVSADFPADDWFPVLRAHPDAVLARTMSRLQVKGQGILLLHDVQPVTVLMLPKLLKELKARGYRIVQLVPADATPAQPSPIIASRSTAPKSVPMRQVLTRRNQRVRQELAAQSSWISWPKFFERHEIR